MKKLDFEKTFASIANKEWSKQTKSPSDSTVSHWCPPIPSYSQGLVAGEHWRWWPNLPDYLEICSSLWPKPHDYSHRVGMPVLMSFHPHWSCLHSPCLCLCVPTLSGLCSLCPPLEVPDYSSLSSSPLCVSLFQSLLAHSPTTIIWSVFPSISPGQCKDSKLGLFCPIDLCLCLMLVIGLSN